MSKSWVKWSVHFLSFFKVPLSPTVKVCFPSISIMYVDTHRHTLISGIAFTEDTYSFFCTFSPSQVLSWRLSQRVIVLTQWGQRSSADRAWLSPCRCHCCYCSRIINALSQSHASFMRLLSLVLSLFFSLSLCCCRGQISCLLERCV